MVNDSSTDVYKNPKDKYKIIHVVFSYKLIPRLLRVVEISEPPPTV